MQVSKVDGHRVVGGGQVVLPGFEQLGLFLGGDGLVRHHGPEDRVQSLHDAPLVLEPKLDADAALGLQDPT